MSSSGTAPQSDWTPESHFAAFWSDPNPGGPNSRLSPDVVGFWPGEIEVRGVDDYNEQLRKVISLIPDVRLEVIEHATNEAEGIAFIHWIAHGNGRKGAFEMHGMDRLRFRDGRIVENRVSFDTALFRDLVGADLPGAES